MSFQPLPTKLRTRKTHQIMWLVVTWSKHPEFLEKDLQFKTCFTNHKLAFTQRPKLWTPDLLLSYEANIQSVAVSFRGK